MRFCAVSCLIALSLFAAPASAHFDEGQIYVIDLLNNKVYFVDPDNGWFFAEINPASSLANSPGAIGFSSHGHMLLANYGNDTLIELDGEGGFEFVLSAIDGLDGPWGPSGVVIGPGHGEIFITNFDGDEILSFDEEFGNGSVFADATDGIDNPSALAFLADGHIIVSDRGNRNLHHFNSVTGVATIFDTLPETPIELIIRNNGDIYALTNMGNIFRYIGGSAGNRILLGNYGGVSATGGMDFGPDHDVIYHVSTADASIREIDPDSGSSVVQLVLPGTPISLAVVGSQYVPGTYIEFGEPLAGTGGVEPTIHGHEEPRIGQASEVELHDFVGGATVFLFLSSLMDENEIKGGEFHIGGLGTPAATLFVLPAGGTPGVAGDGEISLPFVMPNEAALVGTKFFIQALGADSGAPFGASFTDCLTMYIGS
jgi:hypothetical protein